MHSRPSHCFDCDSNTTLYSVHDHVWLKAWPDYQEDKARVVTRYGEYIVDAYEGTKRHPMNCLCLCFDCLEKRLGRPLTIDDFDGTRANDGIRFGHSLAQINRGRPLKVIPLEDLPKAAYKILLLHNCEFAIDEELTFLQGDEVDSLWFINHDYPDAKIAQRWDGAEWCATDYDVLVRSLPKTTLELRHLHHPLLDEAET